MVDTLVRFDAQSGTDRLDDLDQNDQNDDGHIHDQGLTAGMTAHDGHGTQTAAADGTVYTVYEDELMGTTVTIAHSGGYVTYYSSLRSDPPISEGQQVFAGDIIGYVGTAAAEADMGPHLHFAVSKDGTLIDPQKYVS